MIGAQWVLGLMAVAGPPSVERTTGPPPIWSAPATCPGATDLMQRVEQRLGRALQVGEVMVSGRIAHDSGGFRLQLETAVGHRIDARTLWANDCETLTDAAALVIAVSVDAVETATVLRNEDAPPVTEAAIEASAPVVAPTFGETPAKQEAGGPAPRRRTRPAVFVATEGGISIGPTPGPSGAVSLRGGLYFGRFGMQIGGLYVPPRTRTTDEAAVRVQLGVGSAHGCGRPLMGRLDVSVCVGFEAGAMRGDGMQVAGARTRHGLWLAAVAGVGLWGRVHPRVGLGVRAEGAGAFVRPQFQLDQPGPIRTLFTPGPVAARVVAGIRIRLDAP